ncbi:MAG TPA: DUF5134 domain-containing protein [Galbitalea sp.]|jgi:hypothetical protein|nr:DUF5134 domain-containing protein [Galbitalea sp.]
MTGPSWLGVIAGVCTGLVALIAAVRILLATRQGRSTDFEIDGAHVLTGICLTGILIPATGIVRPGASLIAWLILWSLGAAWFLVSLVRQVSSPDPATRYSGHHFPHFVLAAAMVYILAVLVASPAGIGATNTPENESPTSTMPGMAGMTMASNNLVPYATLNLLLLTFLIGYLVVLIDRAPRAAEIAARHRYLARDSSSPTRHLAPRASIALTATITLAVAYLLTTLLV